MQTIPTYFRTRPSVACVFVWAAFASCAASPGKPQEKRVKPDAKPASATKTSTASAARPRQSVAAPSGAKQDPINWDTLIKNYQPLATELPTENATWRLRLEAPRDKWFVHTSKVVSSDLWKRSESEEFLRVLRKARGIQSKDFEAFDCSGDDMTNARFKPCLNGFYLRARGAEQFSREELASFVLEWVATQEFTDDSETDPLASWVKMINSAPVSQIGSALFVVFRRNNRAAEPDVSETWLVVDHGVDIVYLFVVRPGPEKGAQEEFANLLNSNLRSWRVDGILVPPVEQSTKKRGTN